MYFFLLGSTICQQTKILVGMVVVFIFCQFFPIVGDVYELMCLLTGNNSEGICVSNVHIENAINFGHFMLMVNSSVNFVFYMTNIAKFREGFLQVILTVYLFFNLNFCSILLLLITLLLQEMHFFFYIDILSLLSFLWPTNSNKQSK